MIKTDKFSITNTKKAEILKILILVCFLLTAKVNICAATSSYSQETRLSIKANDIALKEAFSRIEEQSEFIFFYHDEALDANKKVSINVTNSTIEKVLDELFKTSNNTYMISDRQVFVSKKAETSQSTTMSAQVNKTNIKGNVTDDKGVPLIGASVSLKDNPGIGTITDADGNYSLDVKNKHTILQYNYIGFISKEEIVGERRIINVVMHEDVGQLDEVVVVAYGHQKKESVVGAITTINVDRLKIPGTSNLSTLLSGQLSGVVGMTRSGEPGKSGAAEFYIRGVSSFMGTNAPLVLVDGIERAIDLVDTEDIAAFSILKDASASAVYGVRGANGVVLITTKKGIEGKPRISLRTETGITSPTKLPSFLNSAQWAQFYNEASGTKYYSDEIIQKYTDGTDPDLYPNVDWLDEMYRDFANNQRVNINISGGGSIVRYYVAGSFYNESSIFRNAGDIYDYNSSINYKKYNFRANIDCNVTPSTTLNVNLANIYEKSFSPGRSKSTIWGYAFMTSPNAFPKEYSDGTISAPSSDSGYNPWNLLVHSGYREQFWNSSQSLIGITQDIGKLWKPLNGLTANVKFSWDAFNSTLQIRDKEPTQYHATGRDQEGNLIFGNPIRTGDESLSYSTQMSGSITTYLEASLVYNRLFDEKHRVGGLFLYNHKIQYNTSSQDKDTSLPYKNQGVAGRVTYAFKDTYMGELNVGYNGSEKFARGHRFGFFPAVAIGWMVSNEPWFEPARKVVDALKIKVSHGKVGNDVIGGSRRWIYEPSIVKSNSWAYGYSADQGGEGIRIGDVENLNVSWEEATKTNIGLELSLFDAIRIQADYFHEKRNGIFMQRAGLPALVGLSTLPFVNIGKAMNHGLDGNIEYAKKIGEVYLTARTNITFNKNKLVNNDQPDPKYKYLNTKGKPFGSGASTQPFGLVALGLFESQEDVDNSPIQKFGEYRIGDIKYQDINGDGVVDAHDMIAIGYTNLPEISYGIGTTAQWKNWDVNVFFQGISHISFFISGTSIYPFSSGNMERATINSDLWGKTWMSDNTDEQNATALYPRMSFIGGAGSVNNRQNSTWNMKNARFMRLKNFEIGYSLSKSLIERSFINSARFYVSGNNLLTFSKFKLWDPERGGGDGSGYPPQRVVSVGLTASF